MQIRFDCPACHQSHVVSVPEMTVIMTCAQTRQLLEIRVTSSGDVKSKVLGPEMSRPK